MKNLKYNFESLILNLNINFSIDLYKVIKYTFLTFIFVAGILALINEIFNLHNNF